MAAEHAYNERIARVENQTNARLRDTLGTARNADEMFRVFFKSNALFVRSKVRGLFSFWLVGRACVLTFWSVDSRSYSRIPDAAYRFHRGGYQSSV